jgi:hypothetical protein
MLRSIVIGVTVAALSLSVLSWALDPDTDFHIDRGTVHG